MSEPMEIDGSVLEGGGQILRIAIGLSALLGIPVKVSKIRANRSRPGLAAQHLKGIQLVAEMCQATLKGAAIGSCEIEFIPGKIKGGDFLADPRTAGSVSLLLQVSLPCALFASTPVTLQLKGGTNADMAPQIDYMTDVFCPALKRFGANFTLDIKQRGYYPKGGAHVTVNINPVHKLNNVTIKDAGTIQSISGYSFVSGSLPLKMAYEMADGAKEELRSYSNLCNFNCCKENARDHASGIVLCGTTSSGCVVGGAGLGRRGQLARDAGAAAARDLLRHIKAGVCLDEYAQDQVIIYMALAEGESCVRVADLTLHTQTAIYIAEKMAKVTFKTEPQEDNTVLIHCTGLGLTNKNITAN